MIEGMTTDCAAANPTYTFALPGVGYRMPKGETPGEERYATQ